MNYGVIKEIEKLKTILGNIAEEEKKNVSENKKGKVSFEVFVYLRLYIRTVRVSSVKRLKVFLYFCRVLS